VADHQNGYVRTSSAAAVAEAVEQWPQTVNATVGALQEFYREKVCQMILNREHLLTLAQARILAPEFDEYVLCFILPATLISE